MANKKPTSTIRCSFCGKPQEMVKKIIAGPNVFICDECIGVCNNIMDSEEYENETGVERASQCIDAIEGGIEAIFFHDKMKACYKDLVRTLGAKYNVPIYKHQRLRNPDTLEWDHK